MFDEMCKAMKDDTMQCMQCLCPVSGLKVCQCAVLVQCAVIVQCRCLMFTPGLIYYSSSFCVNAQMRRSIKLTPMEGNKNDVVFVVNLYFMSLS